MKFLMGIALALWLLCCVPSNLAKDNDFSSFLTANASLAVVVDHEYMRRSGENILANFHKILSDTIRENLKNGGINVKYFTWNAVRLKKDFLAAMTVTDCQNTWKFYESTQAVSVLLIAITDANCPRLPPDRALMIPIATDRREFSQIIFDIKVQKILQWKTAVMLLDQSVVKENPILVESVMYESSRNHIVPFSVLLYKIDDTLRSQRKRTIIREILENFHDATQLPHQFIVLSKFYEDIIELANGMDMFHIYNQWLFVVLDDSQSSFDAEVVTQNLGEGVNIAFMQNETQADCLSSINCTIAEISMAFVTSVSRMILEEQSIYGEISDEEWESIRFTKQEKQDEILGYMKDYLATNSKCSGCARWRIETAVSWGKSEEHRRYRAGKIRETRNKYFEFINIGYWSPVLGFNTQELIFPHMEHYFRNITMNIITMHNPPWQILERNSRGDIIKHSGIVMEILKELSRMLNFTYRLHELKSIIDSDEEVHDNTNDTDDLLGSMTHTVPYQVAESLQNSGFFMAAVAVTIDEPDNKSFNYTNPISVQKYSFITRKPDEVSRIYLFTAPFTLETWACLAGIIIITAPVLYVINRLVPLDHLRISGLCTMKSCFWYIYGALLQQGGMYLPKADSGRLVIGVWWIVVIVLVTTYCGNLVAFLTFPQYQPGLDYFFQLFDENSIEQFGLRNNTFFEKYAALSTRDDFRQYVQRAIIYNSIRSEGMNAVQLGKRANVDWRINLQLVIQKHFEKDKECKFSLAKENFVDEQIGLLMPRGSPYLQLINQQILRMFQMGFIERWHQINLPSMDKCSGKGVLRQITNHKVNLDDMQGCFMVLLFGFTVAAFVIFVEFWYHRLYVVEKDKRKRIFSS